LPLKKYPLQGSGKRNRKATKGSQSGGQKPDPSGTIFRGNEEETLDRYFFDWQPKSHFFRRAYLWLRPKNKTRNLRTHF